MKISDGVHVVLRNVADNSIAGERISSTDLTTTVTLAADAGGPTVISTTRTERVSGFAEEGHAVTTLAPFYNRANGTSYGVEEKRGEDSEYEDRVLVSENDKPRRLGVQVRHLDERLIAALGRAGSFQGEVTFEGIVGAIERAVDAKAAVDHGTRAKTVLLLFMPGVLGRALAEKVRGVAFRAGGFSQVWVYPFHDDPFRVA